MGVESRLDWTSIEVQLIVNRGSIERAKQALLKGAKRVVFGGKMGRQIKKCGAVYFFSVFSVGVLVNFSRFVFII